MLEPEPKVGSLTLGNCNIPGLVTYPKSKWKKVKVKQEKNVILDVAILKRPVALLWDLSAAFEGPTWTSSFE